MPVFQRYSPNPVETCQIERERADPSPNSLIDSSSTVYIKKTCGIHCSTLLHTVPVITEVDPANHGYGDLGSCQTITTIHISLSSCKF